MPQARTRTSTSASPTSGSGTSRTSRCLYSLRTRARMRGLPGSPSGLRSEAGALDLEAEAKDVHVGRDEQGRAVLAERAVAGGLARGEGAQVLALLVEYVYAAGAGGEEMALGVDLHAVGQPLAFGADPARGVEADAPVRDRAVRLDVVGHPDRALRVRVGDVQRLVIGRERDPVGPGEFLRQQAQLAVLADTVDALEVELFFRVLHLARETVGRIGEVERAVRVVDEVVRAVEPLALVAVGDRYVLRLGLGERRVHARDLPVAVLAEHQASLRIEGEAIRPGLVRGDVVGPGDRAEEPALLEVDLRAPALLPFQDAVGRDVGEEQVPAVGAHPQWALGPIEPIGDHLHRRPGGDDGVEAVVDTLDAAERRARGAAGVAFRTCHGQDHDQGAEGASGHHMREGMTHTSSCRLGSRRAGARR